jgi:hypothetical protein
MVVGVALYRFELTPSSKPGKFDPKYETLAFQYDAELGTISPQDLITVNDLFGIFFNYTAAQLLNIGQEEERPMLVGRLKDTPYKYISYYKQEIDEYHYITLTFFKIDEDVELFENLLKQLSEKLNAQFSRLARGNLKDITFVMEVKQAIETEIKFSLFQMDRLGNLDKVQKVALIFASPERVKALELLREGPIARLALEHEIEKVKPNPNIDVILKPFSELNLIRRDWAKGTKDPKSGVVRGEGEYIFLVKDIALIRKPPEKILEQMRRDTKIREQYVEKSKEFYDQYDPVANHTEQSIILSKFLLDPDLYDFLALMKEHYFNEQKIPKITSEFVGSAKVLQDLQDAGIAVSIAESEETKWFVLLSEIVPVVIFPEFILTKIKQRVLLNPQVGEKTPSNTREESEGADEAENEGESEDERSIGSETELPTEAYIENPVDDSLTTEVALIALRHLEQTYYEKLEF